MLALAEARADRDRARVYFPQTPSRLVTGLTQSKKWSVYQAKGVRRRFTKSFGPGSGSRPAQKALPHWLNTLESYPHLYQKHAR